MGRKGEGWVILQFIIFGLLFLTAKIDLIQFPDWVKYSGVFFLVTGGVLGTSGIIHLGKNLSPFPKPVESGSLVMHGIYRIVRHPIYSGIIFGTFGWSLMISNIIGIFLTLILLIFFDAKSRREEKWLMERYPEYVLYRKRVKKLFPWIY